MNILHIHLKHVVKRFRMCNYFHEIFKFVNHTSFEILFFHVSFLIILKPLSVELLEKTTILIYSFPKAFNLLLFPANRARMILSHILLLFSSSFIQANNNHSSPVINCNLKATYNELTPCGETCTIKYEVVKLQNSSFGGKSCSDVARSKNFLPDSQSKSGYIKNVSCFSTLCRASHCGAEPSQTATTTVSSLCPTGVNCLPGFTIVGSGFNVWTGHVEKPIVAYSFLKNQTYNGKHVPDQQTITPDNYMNIKVKSETFDSVDAYSRTFALAIGVDGILKGIPLGGSFQISNKYNKYYQVSSKHFRAVKSQSLWKAYLSQSNFDLMTSTFKNAVKNLPREYSYGSYLYFIEEFGTHIITRANFGGMYVMESSMCSSFYKSSDYEVFKNMAEIGLKSTLSADIGKSSVVAQDQGAKQLIQQRSVRIYGGDPTRLCCASAACGWKNWFGDVDERPYHIDYKVVPISRVIFNARFDTIANNLERAVNEYLERKKVNILKIGSMKCPLISTSANPTVRTGKSV